MKLTSQASQATMGMWIQWNGMVEWTGMVEWNGNKLDTSDYFHLCIGHL